MYNHILVASDGSKCAVEAAHHAAVLARKLDAKLTLVGVLYIPLMAGAQLIVSGYVADDSECAEVIQAMIEPALAAIEKEDVTPAVCCNTGYPADEILRVAEEHDCDLIVMGSRGMGAMKSFLLGSVSDQVVHRAHCPVLIIR